MSTRNLFSESADKIIFKDNLVIKIQYKVHERCLRGFFLPYIFSLKFQWPHIWKECSSIYCIRISFSTAVFSLMPFSAFFSDILWTICLEWGDTILHWSCPNTAPETCSLFLLGRSPPDPSCVSHHYPFCKFPTLAVRPNP